ncbi:MAG: ribonuclease HI family protein [Thermomicrobiales bacterium]|nr:ribonuclease HI family protein [Thermomicrobiales bacterium]
MSQRQLTLGGAEAGAPTPLSSPSNPYVVTFDGGADPNPGKGYGSFHIANPAGRELLERRDYSDVGTAMTNNQAEYRTLIEALSFLKATLGERAAVEHVRVDGDSQLVINQVQGKWKVRQEELKPLRAEAARLGSLFGSITYRWHRRSNSVRMLGH